MDSKQITLEDLHDSYNDWLVAWGARMLMGDRHMAEDVTQNLWLGLAKQESKGGLSFDSGRSVKAYLKGSLRHEVIDYCRKRDKRLEESLYPGVRTASGVSIDDFDSVPAVDGNPAHLVEGREMGLLIERSLQFLPKQYREYIELFVIEGADYSEEAKRLGVKGATLRAGVFRARNEFKKNYRALSGDVQ